MLFGLRWGILKIAPVQCSTLKVIKQQVNKKIAIWYRWMVFKSSILSEKVKVSFGEWFLEVPTSCEGKRKWKTAVRGKEWPHPQVSGF
jgi:hypothetical protein